MTSQRCCFAAQSKLALSRGLRVVSRAWGPGLGARARLATASGCVGEVAKPAGRGGRRSGLVNLPSRSDPESGDVARGHASGRRRLMARWMACGESLAP